MAAASQRDPGDWQDFSGFQPPAGSSPEPARDGGTWGPGELGDKLLLCFKPPPPRGGGSESRVPLRPLSEQSALREDEIWNALTDNYGNVMPVDWTSSHTRALHMPTLNLSEKGLNENLNLDLSDDEELREQLDMHSIIVSCISDEPLFTAEQQSRMVTQHMFHLKNTFTTEFTKCKEGTNVRFLKIAIALDPRFKNLKCLPKSGKDKVWSMLSEVLKEQHSNEETTEPKPPKKKINLLLVASDSDNENEHGSIRNLLDCY